ncbi:hypothetical protein [Streptomyces sp. NPDC002889]|uniref:hypothetical protein n=1 Tax=Streptomyces sp. NPDC002889 TaxID=3364669 RepID=UPI00368CA84A
MTTARHLEIIDLLRARDFPPECGPSDVGSQGPGFHIAELNGHFGDGASADADREAEAEQRLAEQEGLLRGLTERWGEPDTFSLAGTRLRVERDEEVPEPWRRLGQQMGWLHLWRVDQRWIGVGLSAFQLLAVVTETDPP